jgi:cyclohexa-1,5-dienecarbonyl-CoA hydratase
MNQVVTVASNSFARLSLRFAAPAAYLSLKHPPVNVIDLQMMEELVAAIDRVNARDDISMLVVTGGDKAFSAGVDIAVHTPEQVAAMLGKFHSVIRALVATRKVTICAVRGSCLGGGAEIPLVCDMVYTAKTAKWGFPEIQLACFPPVAVTALAAVVGQKRAAELVLTGRTFSGEYAASIGLANEAVEENELDAVIERVISRMKYHSTAALGIAKRALYAWDAAHFDKGLARAEKIYLEELMKTEDVREAIEAWIDKRTPVWRGK